MTGELMYSDWFDRDATEHPCPVCEHSLNRVRPSQMVVCDNPACANDEALFLIKETP